MPLKLSALQRFLLHTTAQQNLLNDLLKTNLKGNTPITWTAERDQGFEACKQSLIEAVLLSHPVPGAQLVIKCDASDSVMGAVL